MIPLPLGLNRPESPKRASTPPIGERKETRFAEQWALSMNTLVTCSTSAFSAPAKSAEISASPQGSSSDAPREHGQPTIVWQMGKSPAGPS
jgi:hypothetical protein